MKPGHAGASDAKQASADKSILSSRLADFTYGWSAAPGTFNSKSDDLRHAETRWGAIQILANGQSVMTCAVGQISPTGRLRSARTNERGRPFRGDWPGTPQRARAGGALRRCHLGGERRRE